MRIANLTRILGAILIGAMVISGLTSCGEPDQAAPTDVVPSPTTELFESPILPEPTLPPLTIEAGAGGFKGMLAEYPSSWDGKELTAYFAPFYPGEEEGGGGIYVFEPSIHPSTGILSSGAFQLGTITPGSYVVAIGPEPESALVILDGDRPRVFEITEGEILEISNIVLQE